MQTAIVDDVNTIDIQLRAVIRSRPETVPALFVHGQHSSQNCGKLVVGPSLGAPAPIIKFNPTQRDLLVRVAICNIWHVVDLVINQENAAHPAFFHVHGGGVR